MTELLRARLGQRPGAKPWILPWWCRLFHSRAWAVEHSGPARAFIRCQRCGARASLAIVVGR